MFPVEYLLSRPILRIEYDQFAVFGPCRRVFPRRTQPNLTGLIGVVVVFILDDLTDLERADIYDLHNVVLAIGDEVAIGHVVDARDHIFVNILHLLNHVMVLHTPQSYTPVPMPARTYAIRQSYIHTVYSTSACQLPSLDTFDVIPDVNGAIGTASQGERVLVTEGTRRNVLGVATELMHQLGRGPVTNLDHSVHTTAHYYLTVFSKSHC